MIGMHYSLQFVAICLFLALGSAQAEDPSIHFWYGDRQSVGHLGQAQNDFNLLGHIENWREVDRLSWSLNGRSSTPLQFRSFRRLVEEGDFNADIPTSWMKPGDNKVTVAALLKDGRQIAESVTVIKSEGDAPLPTAIAWDSVEDLQEVGQAVDGKWWIEENGLRTGQIGYDRLFLIGNVSWQDYDVRTTITIHEVPKETSPLSGGNGLGVIWRFAGHVVGGFRDFPSAQPKWGYQPFGAIGWLRWPKAKDGPPFLQFYPGSSDRATDYGRFPYSLETDYALRLRCETLEDADDGSGVTRYSFKIWLNEEEEPVGWTWIHLQSDQHALRRGGPALVAHHVDATFGNIEVSPIPAE